MGEQERPSPGSAVLPGVDRYRVTEAMFEGIRVVLSYRGEPYSPAYVQGISGAAFRIGGPCPCAPTCGQAMEPDALVRLFGYEAEPMPLCGEGIDPVREVGGVIARIKEEIRRGRPALLWHAFTAAEWDVVCGYDDARGTFLGRGSYAGLDGYAEELQQRTVTVVEICPCFGALLIGERTAGFDAPAAEMASLREAVRHARTPGDRLAADELGTVVPWRYRNGLGCYDWWINAFAAEPLRAAPFGERYCLAVFRSTHAAAADFLRELADRYPGADRHLLRAATAFDAEAATLTAGAAVLFPGWQVLQAGDASRSAEAVRLLSEARRHYAGAIDAIEQALAAMPAAAARGDAASGAVPATGTGRDDVSDTGSAKSACCGGASPAGRDVCIAEKAGFLAAGCYYRGKNERGEVPALWDNQFIPRWDELRAEPHRGTACYGLGRTSEACAPGEFEYLACLAVETLASLPQGMVGWEVPAATYAITRARDVPDLAAAFDCIFSHWLPATPEWVAAEGTCVEYYPPTFAQDGVVEVWVPVRPA